MTNLPLWRIWLGLLLLSMAALEAQGEDRYELVSIVSEDVFVPDGFDDNDEAVVVLDGYMPSSCYQVDRAEITIDEDLRLITIDQLARRYEQPCALALVPFTSVVSLGVLPQGEFTVITKSGRHELGLLIKESTAMGPDDHLYAPIDNLSVHQIQANGRYFADMAVRLTSSCMRWVDYEFLDQGMTIVIKPKVEVLERPVCKDEEKILHVMVPLPADLDEGRYLMHTRTLNGKSVNVVFSVMP